VSASLRFVRWVTFIDDWHSDGVLRLPMSDAKLPKIPVQTLSCQTAKSLLSVLRVNNTLKSSNGLFYRYFISIVEIRVVVIELQVIWNTCYVFGYFDKSNLYFVNEIQLVCILCNWKTFLCKVLKVTENNTSAGCIRFSAVLGIMFQRVFSMFPFIYHILNCHSVNIMPRNMFFVVINVSFVY